MLGSAGSAIPILTGSAVSPAILRSPAASMSVHVRLPMRSAATSAAHPLAMPRKSNATPFGRNNDRSSSTTSPSSPREPAELNDGPGDDELVVVPVIPSRDQCGKDSRRSHGRSGRGERHLEQLREPLGNRLPVPCPLVHHGQLRCPVGTSNRASISSNTRSTAPAARRKSPSCCSSASDGASTAISMPIGDRFGASLGRRTGSDLFGSRLQAGQHPDVVVPVDDECRRSRPRTRTSLGARGSPAREVITIRRMVRCTITIGR